MLIASYVYEHEDESNHILFKWSYAAPTSRVNPPALLRTSPKKVRQERTWTMPMQRILCLFEYVLSN